MCVRSCTCVRPCLHIHTYAVRIFTAAIAARTAPQPNDIDHVRSKQSRPANRSCLPRRTSPRQWTRLICGRPPHEGVAIPACEPSQAGANNRRFGVKNEPSRREKERGSDIRNLNTAFPSVAMVFWKQSRSIMSRLAFFLFFYLIIDLMVDESINCNPSRLFSFYWSTLYLYLTLKCLIKNGFSISLQINSIFIYIRFYDRPVKWD